jgi:type IV secretory pathway VirB3-like protein
MRYLVLVWSSIIVTIGFVIQKDVLSDSGERICSTVGLATALTAGAAYLICLNLSLAETALALHGGETRPSAILGNYYSAIEFVACVTTYVTTAVFAAGMGRVGLLGRSAAAGYVTMASILVLLIILRGLEFPEISANTAPWYTRPGVIAGIPAIPWIMPGLLGAVLLRRARGPQA